LESSYQSSSKLTQILAEIRRITVQSQQFVRPYFKKPFTIKQLRPIGKGEQILEKRLDQKELT
jgi:hypothetical protein